MQMETFLTPTNNVFFLGIAALFLTDFFTWAIGGGKNHRSLRTEIVATGIIGTFWGIAMGLYGFDEDKIGASVPILLTGMKTAFATSIAGMVASLILGVLQRIFPAKHGKTGDPISDQLAEQNLKLEEIFEATNQANSELNDQMKLLRQDSSEASKKIAETITEQHQNLSTTFKESLGEINETLGDAMEKKG